MHTHLELRLPGNLHKINTHPITNNQHGQIPNIRGTHQKLGRFLQSHTDLFLLLLRSGLFLIDAFWISHDLALHVGEDGDETSPRDGYGSHKIL